jgi:hypothetical protein
MSNPDQLNLATALKNLRLFCPANRLDSPIGNSRGGDLRSSKGSQTVSFMLKATQNTRSGDQNQYSRTAHLNN